ncbi:unnamed protein product [Laminaria digitata]
MLPGVSMYEGGGRAEGRESCSLCSLVNFYFWCGSFIYLLSFSLPFIFHCLIYFFRLFFFSFHLLFFRKHLIPGTRVCFLCGSSAPHPSPTASACCCFLFFDRSWHCVMC